ncbi:hypothetical protein ACLMJK_009581 [Lecanora helva]
MDQETNRPAFTPDEVHYPSPYSSPWISYGLPYPVACAKHVAQTFHARRVYILASGSLSRNTDAVSRLQEAIERSVGDGAVVGITRGIRPHSHYSDILGIVKEAKSTKADCLLTLGAGSLTDAAKIVSLALANDAISIHELETLRSDSPTLRDPILQAQIPTICIPTSLSAGEYTSIAGGTNDTTHHKHLFRHPSICPKLVILDPDLSKTTPERIWLSTGVRAVDHCVEGICSIEATPKCDRVAELGLRRLLPSLLHTKIKPVDLEPRLQCQLGAIDAIAGVLQGVPLGASHGIGHQLGPLGVGHGETSCILLPSVCKLNAPINSAQQQKVLDILWSEPASTEVLKKSGFRHGEVDLGDALDAIFKELGMSRSLKDVGIGRDKLDELATSSLTDHWCKTNPKSLAEKEHVLEVLDMVIG